MAEVRGQIEALEHEADNMKKEIRLHMPKSLFMPVPREDLLELLLVQDKIANRTKDVSGVIIGRKMKIPEQIAPTVPRVRRSQHRRGKAGAQECPGAGRAVYGRLQRRRSRAGRGFDRRTRSHRDAHGRATDNPAHCVFEIEKTLDPIDAMFLYEVIELTGEIADMAERVGRRLELLLS